jgi:prophage regulatory protein
MKHTAVAADAPRVFARLPTVIQVTGLSRSTIYRMVASGAFPAPVQIGARAVAWRWADLERWSEARHKAPVDAGSAPRARSRAAAAWAQPHPPTMQPYLMALTSDA